MDQQISNELPPVEVPRQSEQIGPNPAEAPMMPTHTEAATGQAIERGQSAPGMPPQQTPMSQPFPTAAPADPGLPTTPANMPAIADDTDLIEKEWVVKAKEIVARTKNDPYQQNKEVERVKAEYLKKRYNKDVKIAED